MGLLEKAVNLDSIIMLQDRLSDVRYELENYKAQLRTYDDRISYSTVTISVSEVTKVSEPVPETVGERIASGWKNTMEDIAKGAQDALVWFVINLPYLVFWGAILCTLVIFFRKKRRERKQRRIEKQKENDAEKIKFVAKTANVNFVIAKQMLEKNEACILKAKASKIKSVIARLQELNIDFSVKPSFKY